MRETSKRGGRAWVSLCRLAVGAGVAIMGLALVACGDENGDSGPGASDAGGQGGEGAEGGSGGGSVLPPPPNVLPEVAPFPGVFHDGEGPETQQDAAAAIGGGLALVAWADGRAQPYDYSKAIFASRVGADGAVLDDEPIRISFEAASNERPAVAFGGDVFLVVWWTIPQATVDPAHVTLRAARVALDGTVLDPDGFAIDANTGPPAVTFADGRFFIAYEADVNAPLRVTTVTPAGAVEATVDIDDNGFSPALGSDGTHALLSYGREVTVNDRSQHLLLLDADLQTLAEQSWGVQITQPSTVAGGPSGFAVGWNDLNDHGIRRLDPIGDWLDPSWIDLPGSIDSIARDGDGYLFVSPQEGARRLDDASSTVGPVTPFTLGYPLQIASDGALRLAFSGDIYTSDVMWLRLDDSGAPLDAAPTRADRAHTAQLRPVVTALPSGPFVAFEEATHESRAIRYGRVDASAQNPTSMMHEIADAIAPSVATGPAGTLLVWTAPDFSDFYWAVANDDGTLGEIHPAARAVSTPARVASTTEGFFLTYTLPPDDTDRYEAFGLAISTTGEEGGYEDLGDHHLATPLGIGSEPFALLSQIGYPSDLSLACPSTQGLATFGVTAVGAPAVATDGSRALVTWVDHESYAVMGAIVDATCATPTPFQISGAGVRGLAPAVTYDGASFIVAWREVGEATIDLRATRVATDGASVDPIGFVLSGDPEDELAPAFGRAGEQTLVAYARYDAAADAVRVYMRALEE